MSISVTLKTWQKAQALLKEKKADCEVYFSSQTESIADIVRKLTSSGEEVTLLLFGGDGTMNEAVNGIADFEKTKVGFVPCGSGNDLAKALGISRDLNTILDSVIENRTVRELDVGELTVHKSYDRDGKLISDEDFTRRFNISSGMGFDAEIFAHVESPVHSAAAGIEDSGQDMFAAVALHVVEAAGPVKGAADAAVRGGKIGRIRYFDSMHHIAVFCFLHIHDFPWTKHTEIAALSAAFREERGLIQLNEVERRGIVAFICGLGGSDHGVPLPDIYVLLV